MAFDIFEDVQTRIKEIKDITYVELYQCDCNTLARIFLYFYMSIWNKPKWSLGHSVLGCFKPVCTIPLPSTGKKHIWPMNTVPMLSYIITSVLKIFQQMSCFEYIRTITIASNIGGFMFSLSDWMKQFFLSHATYFVVRINHFKQFHTLSYSPQDGWIKANYH